MSQIIDAYNASKQAGGKQTLAEFQKTFTPTAPAPVAAGAPPAQNTPVQPNTVAPTGFTRDKNLEAATIKKLGLSNIQAMQLADNPAFQKQFLDMAYGANASQLPEYQKLTAADQERQGLGDQMGKIRQNAPNAMLALEDALRTKKDVGNQELGQSDLFKKAGLDGFFNLNQSLADNSRMMQERYGSFINALSRVGQYQSNQYRGLADQYKTLTDTYNQKQQEMNQVLEQVQKYNEGLEMAERQFKMQKEMALYNRRLEQGSLDPSIMDENRGRYETGDLRSSQTTNIKGMRVIDDRAPNGDNCILYQRDLGAVMPYGLYTIEDKRNAIAQAGSTNMNNIQIGDVIMTAEGQYGHGAKVIGMDGDDLILEEANYKPGLVTVGRRINKNDKKVLGYFEQEGRTASYPQIQVGDEPEMEGYNTSIEEQTLGGMAGGNEKDILSQAQALVLGMKGTGDERANTAKTLAEMVKSGQADNVLEAKKILGFRTVSDDLWLESANTEIKPVRDVYFETNAKLSAMPDLLNSKTGVADLAAVVNFLKTTDPRSIARETEVDSVTNAISVMDSVTRKGKQLATGVKLDDSQRKQLLDAANILVNANAAKYYESVYGLSKEAVGRGIEPTFTSQSAVEALKKKLGAKKVQSIQDYVDGVGGEQDSGQKVKLNSGGKMDMDKAIKILKENNKPVTSANINFLMNKYNG